eukprot:7475748-Prorocentrum_lima.AAC.1
MGACPTAINRERAAAVDMWGLTTKGRCTSTALLLWYGDMDPGIRVTTTLLKGWLKLWAGADTDRARLTH